MIGALTTVLARSVRRRGIPAWLIIRWSVGGVGWTVVGMGKALTVLTGPALVLATLRGRRVATAVLVLLIAPPVVEWLQRRPSLDPIRWSLASVADDMSYGAGVWAGCARTPVLRSAGPGAPPARCDRRVRCHRCHRMRMKWCDNERAANRQNSWPDHPPADIEVVPYPSGEGQETPWNPSEPRCPRTQKRRSMKPSTATPSPPAWSLGYRRSSRSDHRRQRSPSSPWCCWRLRHSWGSALHYQQQRSVTSLNSQRARLRHVETLLLTARSQLATVQSQSDAAAHSLESDDRPIGGGPDPTGPCTGRGLRPGCEHLPARHLPLRCGEVPQSDLSGRSDRGSSHVERRRRQLSERGALRAMNRWSAYDLLDPDDDSGLGDSGSLVGPARLDPAPLDGPRSISLFVLGVMIAAVVAYDAVTIGSIHRVGASMSAATAATKRAQSELLTTTSEIASTTKTRNTRQMAASRALAQVAVRREEADHRHPGRCASDPRHHRPSHLPDRGVQRGDRLLHVQSPRCSQRHHRCFASLSVPRHLQRRVGLSLQLPRPVRPDHRQRNTSHSAPTSAAGNIQILQSSDLNHWTTVGDALPHMAAWAQPGATWAPSVLQRGNSYVLYYSALDGTTGDQCISEAVAGQPQGPYRRHVEEPPGLPVGPGRIVGPQPLRRRLTATPT